jgi:hypothetical protein
MKGMQLLGNITIICINTLKIKFIALAPAALLGQETKVEEEEKATIKEH